LGAVKVRTCECCGHPVPVYDALSKLTPFQQRIFSALESAGQVGLSRAELFERVYGHDPNGGPDCMNGLNVQRSKMAKALSKHGMKISSNKGHYARWKLEAL